MERMPLPWQEYEEGMQVIYGDLDDQWRISYLSEVEYAERDGEKLHLQMLVHRDPIPGKRYPLLVYVTGSGWQTQERFDRLPQMVDFARDGYVVAVVEYRNTDNGHTFPAQIEDAKTAIRFLRRNAERYHIDPKRVAIWGDSSGAHTALMVGMTDETTYSWEKAPKESASVKCIVDFYGPSDMTLSNVWPEGFPSIVEHEGPGSPENLFFGGPLEEHRAEAVEASPLSHISKDRALPPILIMHGDQDTTVLLHQSVMLYRKLKECGQKVDFYVVRNAAHGYQFWTKPVLDVVRNYLKAYL